MAPVCFAMTELNHGSDVSKGNRVFQQMGGRMHWQSGLGGRGCDRFWASLGAFNSCRYTMSNIDG